MKHAKGMLDPKRDTPRASKKGGKGGRSRSFISVIEGQSLHNTPLFQLPLSLYIFDPTYTPFFVNLNFRNTILFNNCPFSR